MDTKKFKLLRAASEASHPGYGAWLFDTWHAHNLAYFDGVLEVIPIIWGLLPHGHALGYFDPNFIRIILHPSLINPKGANPWQLGAQLGESFASDVLLHEMIHQAIFQENGESGAEDGTSSHNNPLWVDEVNRIAPLLGLPANAAVVKQKRVQVDTRIDKKGAVKPVTKPRWIPEDGMMTLAELGSWPHTARGEHHYTNGKP